MLFGCNIFIYLEERILPELSDLLLATVGPKICKQPIFSVSGLWLSSPNYPAVFQCNVDQVCRFEGLLPKIIEINRRPESGQRLPVLLRELFEGKLVERRLNRPKNDFVLRISEDFLGL